LKKFFVLILLFNIKYICYSQIEINPFLSTCSVLVEAKGFGSGSGIYLQDSNNIYFVTAAHVLYNLEKNKPHCDSIFLITYRENSEIDRGDTLFLNLCDAMKNGYALFDRRNDILVVKIASQKNLDSTLSQVNYLPHAVRLIKATRISAFPSNQLKKMEKVILGNDILIFGYPKSLKLQYNSFDFNRPLLRKGVVAARDFNSKRIILDCPVYKGNSGGPVYMIDVFDTNNSLSLIGIVSEFMPFVEYWVNDKYGVANTQITNSGYSIIIPIDFALNLIPFLK
jgi:hypothetical protein